MGEVYRARDTKLNRDVALKILPESFTADPDRLARFRREAQVLASLNHPNIAAIYGFEDSGATHALVMEFVDGLTVAELIDATGDHALGLSLADVLPIARQIAEALEAAHETGIIHRDLKPANVKVRTDGTVKVLDFGLAKAIDPAGSSPSAMANSPTLTARATQLGMILGTAAYMAPEQARGRAVDRRADIWAFGVVVYEMLSGRRAFDGDDISITLASVLKEDVRWDALPADLPSPLQRLLRRCLEKDPKRRLSWIGEARLILEDPASLNRDVAISSIAGAPPLPLWRRAMPWAVAALGLAAALVSIALWAPWRTTPVPTPRKLLVGIGVDASMETILFGAPVILSPDGTTLAVVAQVTGGQTQLFIRKLDQLQAAPLAGTEGASSPFFSPDGQWIAFFAGSKLKKVQVTGGAPAILCDAESGRGGTFVDDDTIIFTPSSSPSVKLLRVSASGGTPAVFGTLGEGATTQRWPQALPGGKAVLYTEHSAGNGFDNANLVVAPLAGGAPKIVMRGAYYGRYVPSGLGTLKRDERGRGHLLYMQQGTLFAVPFNLDRLETAGQAVPAIDGLSANPGVGGATVAFSGDGTLVYVPGSTQSNVNSIDWMTRDGKTSTLRAAKAGWANPRFSPDGQKLAMEITDGKQRDIWVYDWARDTLTQLTFDAANDRFPVWTPDGKRIVFGSDRAKPGVINLYWVNADGTGEPTRLTDSPNQQQPVSWHPNGRFLAFHENRGGSTAIDLMMLPMEGDAVRGWTPGAPTVFLATPAIEVLPTFSPDGRWLAYQSNELGSFEIFVRAFPGPGSKWRISTDGGVWPAWSPASRELLFLNQFKVMVAPYTVEGDSFKADKPQLWSPVGYQSVGGVGFGPYALNPDGKRLALAAADPTAPGAIQDKVVLVSNFFDYLNKIAPAKK
jgi:serine/threonine-protein kinase